MDILFLKILNMSLTASWLMAAVIILRFLMKKAPKWMSCALWALVALRLLCPFSVESAFSLIPGSEPLRGRMLTGPGVQVNAGVPSIGLPVNSYLDRSEYADAPAAAGVTGHGNPVMTTLGMIWLIGIFCMLAYGAVSYYRIYRSTRASLRIGDRILQCDGIDTPFILGMFRPRIYLPSDMEESRTDYVVAHEKAHIKRLDHWWKPAGFIILSVYWFNPFCWISYILLCRDIELACDERVIRSMDLDSKKSYSEALLSCSIRQRMITACPLAFGEVGVKERVKSVLNYKRPAFWIILVSAAACIAVAVCFLTDPAKEKGQKIVVEAGGMTDGIGIGLFWLERSEILLDIAEDRTVMPEAQEELLPEMLRKWARAFVNRDGAQIADMSSEELKAGLRERELLAGTEGSYSFGLSSPWPADENTDFFIRRYDGSEAEIIYYAYTSEPHVTSWGERLSYEWNGEKYVMTGETLTWHDSISSGAEFEEAYCWRIDGTMLDYTRNGLGEALNDNAFRSDGGAYEELFSPESAAVCLLNLSADADDVRITRRGKDTEGLVGLDITFSEDGGTYAVSMIQPYGKNGIWVPADYRVDVVVRFMDADWDKVREIPYTGTFGSGEIQEIICLGEIPEEEIRVYGYADEEYSGSGVAVDIAGNVSYFDWEYMSPRRAMPDLYWDGEKRQLQISFPVYTGTGVAAEELHVLQYYDTGTLVSCDLSLNDYEAMAEERMGYGYSFEGPEGKRSLVLVDNETKKGLADVDLSDLDDKDYVSGIEYGCISGFELGETITFWVTPGYFLNREAVARYEGMPTLEFELIMSAQEDGTSIFRLGEAHVR